jgi:hypothetical protein
MHIKPKQFIQILGIGLIALGALALIGQILQINIGAAIWPFFVILPGTLLFLFALSLEPGFSEPVAMIAGVIAMTGLLLLYQSLTGHWVSWAYGWSLIAPVGAGLGALLYGWLQGRRGAVKTGRTLINIGLVIFVVGLLFFELVLNISGLGWDFIGWPILFIGLGLIALLRGLNLGDQITSSKSG